MATDNPRAVDDLTLSKSKKTRLTVWFYISALIILIFLSLLFI